MSKPRVFVTRTMPGPALQMLEAELQVDMWEEDRPIPREEFLRRVPGVDGILTHVTDRVDGELLDVAGQARVVSNYAVGYDNIDVPAASVRGVLVTNTPGVLTDATADMAFALLMAAARMLTRAERALRDGEWRQWQPDWLLGAPVWGATLGVIGLGRIGQAMARRGRGFDMEVLYYSRRRRPELEAQLGLQYRPLEELLAASDFVSLHVPLSEQTHHLIGERELGLMKKSAILINTARGPVVDQKALVAALRTGQIAAAGLDVFEREPISLDNPLLELDNVVLIPHLGSATRPSRYEMGTTAARNLLAAVSGRKPPNLVNPEIWDQRRR
jgi:glyoxylate reductase